MNHGSTGRDLTSDRKKKNEDRCDEDKSEEEEESERFRADSKGKACELVHRQHSPEKYFTTRSKQKSPDQNGEADEDVSSHEAYSDSCDPAINNSVKKEKQASDVSCTEIHIVDRKFQSDWTYSQNGMHPSDECGPALEKESRSNWSLAEHQFDVFVLIKRSEPSDGSSTLEDTSIPQEHSGHSSTFLIKVQKTSATIGKGGEGKLCTGPSPKKSPGEVLYLELTSCTEMNCPVSVNSEHKSATADDDSNTAVSFEMWNTKLTAIVEDCSRTEWKNKQVAQGSSHACPSRPGNGNSAVVYDDSDGPRCRQTSTMAKDCDFVCADDFPSTEKSLEESFGTSSRTSEGPKWSSVNNHQPTTSECLTQNSEVVTVDSDNSIQPTQVIVHACPKFDIEECLIHSHCVHIKRREDNSELFAL